MTAPEFFEIRKGYGYYRPVGPATLDHANGLMICALEYALEQKIERLLVNAANLSMPFPTLSDRYFAMREWARVAGGCMRLAVVLAPEIIDPEGFGALVARNAGLAANLFTSEPKALEWLLNGCNYGKSIA